MRALRAALVAVAAATVGGTPVADARPCGRPVSDGGIPPWQVQLRGVVESIHGNVLRVGANTVVLPPDVHALRLDDGLCPSRESYRVARTPRVGRLYELDGTLRPDGTVLAFDFRWASPAYVEEIGGEEFLFPEAVTGICDAYDGAALTVAGVRLEIVPDGPGREGDEVHVPGGTGLWEIAPGAGDAVGASFVRTPDGRLLARDVLMIRPSGGGTRLAGTIRAFSREGRTLEVDGVAVAFDPDETFVTSPGDPWGGNGPLWDTWSDPPPVVVGRLVEVEGVLREGVVDAEVIQLGRLASRHGGRRPSRRAWMRVNGVVESAGASAFVVNGLAFGHDGPPPPAGARVHVRARLTTDGASATSVRVR